MAARSPWILLGFSLACGFDSEGAGSAEGMLGEASGDSSTSAGTTGASGTGTSSAGTSADTSASATTSPTTSTGTTGPMTTAGDPTSATGGEGGSTDEGVEEGTSTGGLSDTGIMSEGSTTGTVENNYPMCDAMNECKADAMCTQWTLNNEPYGNVCSLPCMQTADCPPPPDSDAMPYCPQGYLFCLLVCETGNCPTGMTCEDTANGPRCMWVL